MTSTDWLILSLLLGPLLFLVWHPLAWVPAPT